MTRTSIAEYAAALRHRYRTAGRRAKGVLLDAFCTATGYHRKAAGRPPRSGLAVRTALERTWQAADHACGKRLAPYLPTLVPALERHGALSLSAETRADLRALRAATIDRLLAPARQRLPRRPFTSHPATSALRAQMPLRTFGEWAGVAPGALQADLVAHCGPTTAGFYLTTLRAVDVATGWTDREAIWGKGQDRVGGGIRPIRERLPVGLRARHTDNGREVLNGLLYPWCQREGVRLTRGRPYRKNDQAWVEQRNGQVVRRLVGYDRFRSHAAHAHLRRLSAAVRLSVHFFQPITKLIDKERRGAKVVKRYDPAQTPYR